MISIKALNDMEIGEELFINYILPTREYNDRKTSQRVNWGFECTCALCHADSQPGNDTMRRASLVESQWDRLLEISMDILDPNRNHNGFPPLTPQSRARFALSTKPAIKQLSDFKDALNLTYPPGRTVKLDVAFVEFELGKLHRTFDPRKGLEASVTTVNATIADSVCSTSPRGSSTWTGSSTRGTN